MSKSIALSVLPALYSVASIAAMEPPEYRLPKMDKAPVVDGSIGADEWKGAIGGFGFCPYPTDTTGPVPVSFKIARTADRLFIAAVRPVGPSGAGVPPAERGRAWGATSDDHYEFVFVGDRTADDPDFRHMTVNATGDKTSLAFTGGSRAPWAAKSVVSKSVVAGGLWTFELSVALDDIGFAGTPPENHAIRLCHTFRNVGTKTGFQSSARPNESGYFTAQRTIPVAFDDDAPAVELLEGRRESNRWCTKLRIFNPSPKARRLSVRVWGRPSESQPGGVDETVALGAGEEKTLTVAGPIIGDELVRLVCVAKDDASGLRYAFREVDWRPNCPAPEWIAPADAGKQLRVRFAYYPSYGKMRVRADVSRFESRPASVAVALEDATGAALARMDMKVGDKAVADATWDVPDLKSATLKTGIGRYRLIVSVPGGVAETNDFRRDVFAWEDFKGGLSGALPPPFTQVKRAKRANGDEAVSVVLREHLVDAKTRLWKQVAADGKGLLARPVRLVTDAPAALSGASFETSWDCDGCCEWRMTLAPGKYRPISVEIPIKAERAKLMHVCTLGLRGNLAGELPAGIGRVWASSDLKSVYKYDYIGDYRPYVWVGGPLRGIAVFGENDKGWVVGAEGVSCQEIWREKDGTVVLKLNIVQKEIDVKDARTIRIGFQATPVKPMEDGWRGTGIGTLVGSCKSWGAYQSCDAVCPYDGTDEFFRKTGEARRTGKQDKAYMARAVEDCVRLSGATGVGAEKVRRNYAVNFAIALRESAARFRNPKKKLVYYTNARGVHLGSREGNVFCDEWLKSEFSGRPYPFRETASYGLNPCASFSDYAAYWYERMLTTGACDYLYWDCIFCSPCYDVVGTDAYVSESGDVQPSGGIFAMRALVRRAAVLQTELGLESRRNWVHMTNCALAPCLSFAGVNYDWEDTDGDKPLHERYGRAYIQAATIGRQFGNKVAVMGYFATKDRTSAKLQRLERCGTGLCLTHELIWGRVPAYRAARGRLVELGYEEPDVKVWNYWDEDVQFPAAIAGGETSALAFAHGGRAVVVVSDWSGGAEYSVAPDAKALGLKAGFRARNAETGEEIAVSDGRVKVTLDKHDYAMVVFE